MACWQLPTCQDSLILKSENHASSTFNIVHHRTKPFHERDQLLPSSFLPAYMVMLGNGKRLPFRQPVISITRDQVLKIYFTKVPTRMSRWTLGSTGIPRSRHGSIYRIKVKEMITCTSYSRGSSKKALA